MRARAQDAKSCKVRFEVSDTGVGMTEQQIARAASRAEPPPLLHPPPAA